MTTIIISSLLFLTLFFMILKIKSIVEQNNERKDIKHYRFTDELISDVTLREHGFEANWIYIKEFRKENNEIYPCSYSHPSGVEVRKDEPGDRWTLSGWKEGTRRIKCAKTIADVYRLADVYRFAHLECKGPLSLPMILKIK